MIKDRAQKASAIRFCVENGWLPHLEVNIEPELKTEKKLTLLTDVDVLAIKNESLSGYKKILFDCKSSPKESAIGRAFWLKGLMERVRASYGFVILNDVIKITNDHRLSASDLKITLVNEKTLPNISKGIGAKVSLESETQRIENWEKFIEIKSKNTALKDYIEFSHGLFWSLKTPGEQCRKSIAKIRSIRTELDPSKNEHLAIFADSLVLMLIGLTQIVNQIFLCYLHPERKEDFIGALLPILFGGYDNIELALKLREFVSGGDIVDNNSIFPELPQFEFLAREMLNNPSEAWNSIIIFRELAMLAIAEKKSSPYFDFLIKNNKFATKYCLIAITYMCKACKLPPKFDSTFTTIIVDHMGA